mgnify:FL=1
MKKLLLVLSVASMVSCQQSMTVDGNSNLITTVGRYQQDSLGKKMWVAGGYFTFAFTGKSCQMQILSEGDYEYSFVDIVVDNLPPSRVKLPKGETTIVIGEKNEPILGNVIYFSEPLDEEIEMHDVSVYRDSETMMGFTQLKSVTAQQILGRVLKPEHRIEFVGNSITSGTDIDTNLISFKDYKWGDWHRAYYAYGPVTARNLNAEYSLASVSGIGLTHSCCDIPYTIADVYDNLIMRYDSLDYDFSFNPDIICCCLGQNDGIQNNDTFVEAYIKFIKLLKEKNANVKHIVLLSSPMADDKLFDWMKEVLTQTVEKAKTEGIDGVTCFLPGHNRNSGGASHPDVFQHKETADELTAFLKTLL